MQLDYILKNKVSEPFFERIVYKWLSEGDYTPDDIIEKIITQNNIVLMPLYYSKDEYYGSCSVSLGYRRLEFYSEWDNVNKRNVQKSRWVTEWRPHSQAVQGSVVTLTYAGQPADQKLIDFVEGMGWKSEELNTISADTQYYEQLCNLFQFSKTEIWQKRGLNKAYNEAKNQTAPKLPSMIQNNLVLDIKFSEQLFFNLLAPFWFFSYEYEQQKFYVIVDGNNPNRIDGIKPEDKRRKKNVIKLKLFGWSVGLVGIVTTLYIFSEQSFDNIDLTWDNIAISTIGVILTYLLVEFEVKKVKDKSKKIRLQLLSNRLKKLEA